MRNIDPKNGAGPKRKGPRRVSTDDVAHARSRPPSKKRHRDRGRPSEDPALVELVIHTAYFNQGQSSWLGTNQVAAILHGQGHDIDFHGVLACEREAFKNGTLVIRPYIRHEQQEVFRLEAMLRDRYRFLRKVILVPGRPEILEQHSREHLQRLHAWVVEDMACRAAEYLNDLVAAAGRNRPEGPFCIGVAWGRTMLAVTQALLRLHPGRPPKHLKVLPIVGITDCANTQPLEANMLALEIARAYGAAWGSTEDGRPAAAQLAADAVVPREQYAALVNGARTKRMLETIRAADVIFTSMGPIAGAEDASDITISTDPELNRQLFSDARAEGASGEIFYRCFDREGRPVDTPWRSVGLELEDLQAIAADPAEPKRQVVLMAGGDRRRIEPLRAALAGRYCSVLVSDTVTARVLLGEIAAW